MKERGILMHARSVQGILKNWKTETRRIVKGVPLDVPFRPTPIEDPWWSFSPGDDVSTGRDIRCPYGVPGDRLWVREAHRFFEAGNGVDYIQYRADQKTCVIPNTEEAADYVVGKLNEKWRPSIFMPRWASRLLLEVKEIRPERLQEITEEGALAEGFLPERVALGHAGEISARRQFMYGWDEINGKRASWKANPWVWVIGFRRID